MRHQSLLFLCIFLTFLASNLGMLAQQNPKFIREHFNHLYFSKDSSAFLPLFNKLRRVGFSENERVRVVHIGGSHVQGGVWSNTFISAFQSEFNTSGGGYFVFPYRVGRTNSPPFSSSFSNGRWKLCRPIGREFCLPLGMSALSVTTNDSACYFGAFIAPSSTIRDFNTFKLYHNFNASYQVDPAVHDTMIVERIENPDEGYTLFRLAAPVDSMVFNLVRKDTSQRDFILYGFDFENDLSGGFFLATLGANGASGNSFQRCSQLIPQLASLNADLVILSLGVNDAQSKGFNKSDFIASYDSLISMVRKAVPGVAIMLTTTTDNYIRRRTPNKRSITAREAMFDLMVKNDVAVWDLFTVMGGYQSMNKWFRAGLASKDKVHFNSRGYGIVGNLMYMAFRRTYQNFLKAGS
jgi:lysophospholipase L1-like esterase